MYLHLGQDTIVLLRDVVGIFDLDNCSVSAITKAYFKVTEARGQVINVSTELPRSFVVTKGPGGSRLYISQLSPATLRRRWRLATGGRV